MRLATKEDLLKMERGTPVVVDITSDVPDICLFIGYNSVSKKILVLDTFLKDKHGRYIPNVHEYDRCLLLELTDEKLANLHYNKA